MSSGASIRRAWAQRSEATSTSIPTPSTTRGSRTCSKAGVLKSAARTKCGTAISDLNQKSLGPAVGSDFYFDPHTKHYTGEQNVLKGWCPKIRGADKVLHSDFRSQSEELGPSGRKRLLLRSPHQALHGGAERAQRLVS